MSIDLTGIRSRLMNLRTEYILQIGEMTQEYHDHESDIHDSDGDLEDAAQEIYSEEMSQGEADNLRMNLQLIDEALARMDDGTYGACLACGKPIDEKRLEVIPYARYCLKDQIAFEE